MTKWRIYYSDGTTVDNTKGGPQYAPSYGIVCIVQPDDMVGRQIMHGWDWYYWHEETQQWWGCDIYGLLDRLLHNMQVTAVKQGRTVSNKDWQSIMQRANEDPDFLPKSSTRKGEHP